MARPAREPPVPSALVPALLRYLEARGADVTLVSLRVELDRSIASSDEALVTPGVAYALLDLASETLGEPHLGLALPEALAFRGMGLAELAARASPTVRGALERIARYAPLILPQLECALEEDEVEARFRQRTRGRARGAGRTANEYALSYALVQCRRESGEALSVSRVWFAHARTPDLLPICRFFGTDDVAFGAPDSGFALDRALLDAPMRGGDARLLVTAEGLADAALRAQPRARAIAHAVMARVEALLPEGGASIEAVARAMHMSPRTLQRRLEEEQTRFGELLEEVRARVARVLLRHPSLGLAEVAARLGFADLATFSRAFKRWTGMPPGQWRRTAGMTTAH
jgi:AraC-like DNA-binding protein